MDIFGPVTPMKEALGEKQNLLLPVEVVSKYSWDCHWT